jgi:SAM-dependent methyltransferase
MLVSGITRDEFVKRIVQMPECLMKLIQSCLRDYETEQDLRNEVESFDDIHQGTSKMIAGNYEQYPYPRWISWHFPKTGQRKKRLQKYFEPAELEFLEKPFQVLVAGCGTGSKAIEYAIGYGNDAQILAIDLSKTSLAYAMRMARRYQVQNIRFLQMDILDLPKLEQQFDIAECTGVLHHMDDPVSGGMALVKAVRDGGIVHISLYSELARRAIVRFREDYGLVSDMSDDDIRKCRREIMQDRPHVIDHELSLRWDFFDLHSCKDLLFHPLEHRFTMPQIQRFLDALGLEFRGFETPGLIHTQYWTHYPHHRDRRNLSRWHQFEEKNPDAFRNLYEIWSKKPL